MKRIRQHLPPGIESGIGRFISNFALLEEYMRGVVCEIGKTSAPAGEILTSQLSFRGLTLSLAAVVQEYVRNPQLREETKALLAKIQAVNEFRNHLVHSLWLHDEQSGVFAIRMKWASNKKGLTPQVERYRKRDLQSKCDEVAELTFQILELYERIKIDQASTANELPA